MTPFLSGEALQVSGFSLTVERFEVVGLKLPGLRDFDNGPSDERSSALRDAP